MIKDMANISMSEALIVTVFSMAIVFATLLVIDLILKGFKGLFYKDEKKVSVSKAKTKKSSVANTQAEVAPSNNSSSDEDEEELVAVITAALAASLERPASEIKIRKIRRVSQNTSSWSRVGRLEQMN